MDGQATDWSVIHAQIALFFADRMPEYHPPLPHIKDKQAVKCSPKVGQKLCGKAILNSVLDRT